MSPKLLDIDINISWKCSCITRDIQPEDYCKMEDGTKRMITRNIEVEALAIWSIRSRALSELSPKYFLQLGNLLFPILRAAYNWDAWETNFFQLNSYFCSEKRTYEHWNGGRTCRNPFSVLVIFSPRLSFSSQLYYPCQWNVKLLYN